MSRDTVLLGIDAGLTKLKVVAFGAGGEALASASAPTPGRSPTPERDDQDHDALWAATSELIAAVLDDGHVDRAAVEGVGVAGHGHGLYALDADGDPVCGVKSTDDRAAGLLKEWRRDGRMERVSRRLGWEPFGADPYSLLAWFDREQPATARRIDTVLFCKDVLKHRLTGSRTTDPMDGSALVPSDGDVEGVLEALGLADYADTVPDRVNSTDRCGTVTATAAAETGLPEGTPVAAGLQDVGACALGAGVRAPGQAAVILGTWGQSVVVAEGPDRGNGGLPRRYLDGWLRYRGTRAGAACLDWFVEEFGEGWRETAREQGVDPYEVYERRASAVPAGANGVLFHPYLSGSTDDPNARGGFYGLAIDHGKADMLRAVYEGVAMGMALGVEAFGVDPHEVRVSGGGAASELWTRLFADLLEGTVRVPAGGEMGARGAALCAGVATGRYDDVEAAVAETVAVQRSHEPDPGRVERYRTLADAFQQARDGLGGTWETLITASGEPGE